jgi:hypothetical protein
MVPRWMRTTLPTRRAQRAAIGGAILDVKELDSAKHDL